MNRTPPTPRQGLDALARLKTHMMELDVMRREIPVLLRTIRATLGLDLAAMGRRLGCTASMVRHLECGKGLPTTHRAKGYLLLQSRLEDLLSTDEAA